MKPFEIGQRVTRLSRYMTGKHGTVLGFSKDGHKVKVHWEFDSFVDPDALRAVCKCKYMGRHTCNLTGCRNCCQLGCHGCNDAHTQYKCIGYEEKA